MHTDVCIPLNLRENLRSNIMANNWPAVKEEIFSYCHNTRVSVHHCSLKGRSSVFLNDFPEPFVTVLAGVAIGGRRGSSYKRLDEFRSRAPAVGRNAGAGRVFLMSRWNVIGNNMNCSSDKPLREGGHV